MVLFVLYLLNLPRLVHGSDQVYILFVFLYLLGTIAFGLANFSEMLLPLGNGVACASYLNNILTPIGYRMTRCADK